MNQFKLLNELSDGQLEQYAYALSTAFPPIIRASEVIRKYWPRLENYFPSVQLFMIAPSGDLIGFINTVPFFHNQSLHDLPDRGWDWMLEKGILDYEQNVKPNCLGGLQVIVTDNYRSQGYSKQIIAHAKKVFSASDLNYLVIPIRPTQKHLFPEMPMSSYLELTDNNQVYDPWIRTHLKGGAKIIKVCEQSMMMTGDIPFWEDMLQQEINQSGAYKLDGALSLIQIDFENNYGEYIEPNIWIHYEC